MRSGARARGSQPHNQYLEGQISKFKYNVHKFTKHLVLDSFFRQCFFCQPQEASFGPFAWLTIQGRRSLPMRRRSWSYSRSSTRVAQSSVRVEDDVRCDCDHACFAFMLSDGDMVFSLRDINKPSSQTYFPVQSAKDTLQFVIRGIFF
jgi:hypothetical protein